MRNGLWLLTMAPLATAVVLAVATGPAPSQEVELVIVDEQDVAKGYSTRELMGRGVVNDKREPIGDIYDFIVVPEQRDTFVVLEVGRFLNRGAHLVAVPVQSLVMNDPLRQIMLPGGSQEALRKLPVFNYGAQR